MNKVTLFGHVGTAPERIKFDNGSGLVKFTLATNTVWKDKATEEKQERTEWHSIIVGRQDSLDNAEKYITKGMKLLVEGEIRYTKKENADGKTQYYTHINCQRFEFGGKPQGGQPGVDESFVHGDAGSTDNVQNAENFVSRGGEDDLPF
jgi:single-strand DNA-binding protein